MNSPQFTAGFILVDLTDDQLVEKLLILIRDFFKPESLVDIKVKLPSGKSIISTSFFRKKVNKAFLLFKSIKNLDWMQVQFERLEMAYSEGNRIMFESNSIHIMALNSEDINFKSLFEQILKRKINIGSMFIENLTIRIIIHNLNYERKSDSFKFNMIHVSTIDKSAIVQIVKRYEPMLDKNFSISEILETYYS